MKSPVSQTMLVTENRTVIEKGFELGFLKKALTKEIHVQKSKKMFSKFIHAISGCFSEHSALDGLFSSTAVHFVV